MCHGLAAVVPSAGSEHPERKINAARFLLLRNVLDRRLRRPLRYKDTSRVPVMWVVEAAARLPDRALPNHVQVLHRVPANLRPVPVTTDLLLVSLPPYQPHRKLNLSKPSAIHSQVQFTIGSRHPLKKAADPVLIPSQAPIHPVQNQPKKMKKMTATGSMIWTI